MLPPDLRRGQAGTCGCAHSPLGRRWGCRSAREQRIAGQLRPSGLLRFPAEERPSHGLYLAEKSGGHTGCGSRGPLRAWRRAGGGWARREGSHRREVLVAAEPSQRSRARAWRPEWCPHEHTNSPTDRGGARHRDLRPRPDEGWNRAEAASSCHSRCRLFFAAERWRRSFFRRK
jgi:hypothetical protein